MPLFEKHNRKAERIELRIPATIVIDGQSIKGELQDFSISGSFISCGVQAKSGAEVRIEFELKGDFILAGRPKSWDELRVGTSLPDVLAIVGHVRWELPWPGRGFGIRFGKLDRKTSQAVAELAGLLDKTKRMSA